MDNGLYCGFIIIIVMFWSAVLTLILTAPIHSIDEQVMNSNEETSPSTSWMAWASIFLFGINYYFNILLCSFYHPPDNILVSFMFM